jgi:hypothetical protein
MSRSKKPTILIVDGKKIAIDPSISVKELKDLGVEEQTSIVEEIASKAKSSNVGNRGFKETMKNPIKVDVKKPKKKVIR